MTRFIKYFICFIFVFVSCSSPQKTLTILHFNDVYNLQPIEGGKVGGAARVATVLKEYEKDNPLILFSGDALGSSYISIYLKGQQMVDGFNRLGLDYAVMGNHEFDVSLSVTKQRVKESKFTWIISNLTNKETGKPVAGAVPWVLTEWNGVKVGIIGLASDWLNITVVESEIAYEDYIKVGKQLSRDLKEKGAQIVIALTHMFMVDDKKLAAAVPDIDLILGGHDHKPMQARVNNTVIWKSGADWENVGLIKIELQKDKKPLVTAVNLPITPKITDDPKMAAVVQKYVKQFAQESDQSVNQVVGKTTQPLNVLRQIVRTQESNLGNFVADAMRDYTGADLALQNGGGLRSNFIYPAGDVTIKNLSSILPFSNHVVSLKLTGKQIKSALEHGVAGVQDTSGQFLQVSGLNLVYDIKQPVGQRIQKVLVNNQPLQENKTYTVATNHYLADGGNGYHMFKNVPRLIDVDSGKLILQVIVEAVKKQKMIAPKVEGRIVLVDRE